MSKKQKTKLIDPPKTIKVGYINYDMRKQNKEWSDKHNAVGETDTQEQVIDYYEQHPSQIELLSTITHELLHALSHFTAIKFPNEEQEEHVVASLANILVLVLKDNPDLVTWIADSLKEDNG